MAIRWAIEGNCWNLVEELLRNPNVDPSVNYNYAICKASREGHVEVVRLIMKDPRVDPSAFGNYAIRYASWRGHVEVVQLLSITNEGSLYGSISTS